MHWNQYGEGRRQFGEIVPGVFTPVLAKHSKSFSTFTLMFPAQGKISVMGIL